MYDKGKHQHGSVHTQVVVVVEGGVSMLFKVDSKAFQVPGKQSLKTNHVYLDRCSTYMQSTNTGILTDFHESETFLYGHCNAITKYTNLKGKYIPIDCWLNKEVIDNIFSIPVLKNMDLCIIYDSCDNHCCVSKDNIIVKFEEDKKGLPYIDGGEKRVVFAQTVRQSYKIVHKDTSPRGNTGSQSVGYYEISIGTKP